MSDVGENTGRWDLRELPTNVMIGRDVWIERKESFKLFRSAHEPGLVIGDRVRIYTWTTFNVEPTGTVEIGDDSVLVGAVFMCADRVTIGRRAFVSYGVTIADSDFHPVDMRERRRDAVANAPFGDRTDRPALVARPVTIGDDAWIGVGAIVLKGVTIGAGARIGAGSVVSRSVPDGMAAEGNPAVVTGPVAR